MKLILILLIQCLLLISCGKEIKDSKKSKSTNSITPETTESQNFSDELKRDLLQAINSADTSLVDEVLSKVPHVDFVFSNGETPLTYAMKYSKVEIIFAVLKKVKHYDFLNDYSESPLWLSIKYNYNSIFYQIIDKNVDINIAVQGITLVELASFQNKEEIAIELIAGGANIEKILKKERFFAHIQNEINLRHLNALLESIMKKNKYSDDLVEDAIKTGDYNYLKYLYNEYLEAKDFIRNNDVLTMAMDVKNANVRIQTLRFLLQKNANPNFESFSLPIINAILKKQIRTIRILIPYMADTFKEDQFNLAPLDYTIKTLSFDTTYEIYKGMQEQVKDDNREQFDKIKSRACESLLRRDFLNDVYSDPYTIRKINNLLNCY